MDMNYLTYIIHFAAVFGVTNALVFLHVGTSIRRWVSGVSDETFQRGNAHRQSKRPTFRSVYLTRLVRCHACAGFWIGSLFSFARLFFQTERSITSIVALSFYEGASASCICFLVWVAIKKRTEGL